LVSGASFGKSVQTIFDRDIYVTPSQQIVLSTETLFIQQKNERSKVLLPAAFTAVFPDEDPGWPMAGGGIRRNVAVGSIATDPFSGRADQWRYAPNSDHSSLKADVRLKSPGFEGYFR
jgi:hypothetical protein